METQVRTPQAVFMLPQRLLVPLFQRPYVWNLESQWEPLWQDLARVTERSLRASAEKPQPHFLGAVVLQQVQNPTGHLQARTIIDGQQRLTTLQLLLDALHSELERVGADQPALRVRALVENPPAFCASSEDRFKVWPTNRDRGAFSSVMSAPPPVDHDGLAEAGERLVDAHKYFSHQIRDWLAGEPGVPLARRAEALERTARELLQLVVIDLAAEENAQEIFETLNARGAQLTAADLIKNFVFQRLAEEGADVQQVYQDHWHDFETGFWETEVTTGRLRYPRSSVFLNHWLVAETGEEVVAKDVFLRFKRHADDESGRATAEVVARIHRAADVYRRFVEDAATRSGPISRLGLFGYRTGAMESEVVKPLVLWLLDPQREPLPAHQLTKSLEVVESWMVRRMLVRASTKDYSRLIADIIRQLDKGVRSAAGDEIERILREQQSESRHWPDDDEVRSTLRDLPIYRRLSRARLRMVLEALEDSLRGWHGETEGLGGERVERGKRAIEHLMPRKWLMHWPLPAGRAPEQRDRLVQTLGNLTLLTTKLNSRVSNGPWDGATGKRVALHQHDVLLLNRQLLHGRDTGWDDDAIESRTEELVEHLLRIWPVPEGHRSSVHVSRPSGHRRVTLADLIAAGRLEPGQRLYPRRRADRDRVTTLLPDGQIDVEGVVHATPGGAARAILGRTSNGWNFFLVDPAARRALLHVYNDYVADGDGGLDDRDEDDDDTDD